MRTGGTCGLGYDYICWSQDGTTVSCGAGCPQSASTTTGLQHTKAADFPASTTLSTGANLQAVGCLDSPGANGNTFLPSDTPPATAGYSSITQVQPPTIDPITPVSNNTPLQVSFANNEPLGGATVYFCVNTATGGTVTPPTCDYTTTPVDESTAGCRSAPCTDWVPRPRTTPPRA